MGEEDAYEREGLQEEVPEGELLPGFEIDRCKRCGICSHFCPLGAIVPDEHGVPRLAHPEACVACGLCERLCPDWAIGDVSAARGAAKTKTENEKAAPASRLLKNEALATRTHWPTR